MNSEIMSSDLSIWGMFQHADMVVKVVMVGLLFASVVTWALFFSRLSALVHAKKRLIREQNTLKNVASLSAAAAMADTFSRDSHSAALLTEASQEIVLSQGVTEGTGVKERIQFRLERRMATLLRQAGQGNGFLATIGSVAPFIGLFGTVWGIMNSFIGIARMQTTNLAVVAPGIAEALLATAFGLVAAIPAVVIYNLLVRYIAGYKALLGDSAAQVLLLQSRDQDLARQSDPQSVSDRVQQAG